MLKQTFNVARQFFHACVADRNAEVIAGYFFQFVRLIEDDNSTVGEDAGIGRVLSFQFDGKVGEEEMMIDDDNVALGGAAAHLSNEAALVLFAFLSETGIGARVQFVPKRARL